MTDSSQASADAISKATDAAEAFEKARIAQQRALIEEVLEAFHKQGANSDEFLKLQRDIKEHIVADAAFQSETATFQRDMMTFQRDMSTLIEDVGKTIKLLGGRIDPITDAYKAVLLSKSFITGVAAVVLAIGAIGAGVIYIVNASIRH